VHDQAADANGSSWAGSYFSLRSIIDNDIFIANNIERLIRINDNGCFLINTYPHELRMSGYDTDQTIMPPASGKMLIDNSCLDKT